MTRLLCSARLLYLHRRSFLRPPFASAAAVAPSPSPAVTRSSWRLQWSNQYSVGVNRPAFNSEFLEKIYRIDPPKPSVPLAQADGLKLWMSLLKYLSQSSENAATPLTLEGPRGLLTNAVLLARYLGIAQTELNMDLFARLDVELNSWSTIYDILSRLVDAAEVLNEACPPRRGVIEDYASNSRLSLDQLTDHDLSSSSQAPRNSSVTELTSLDVTTHRSFARDCRMLLMAEVWKGLGSIVLCAANTSPAKSEMAMSVVHRILARLHHSGLISERVYKYTTPDRYQAIFRPPGIQLLSSHIMDVLSNAAWLVHEAEVAAKAAAAGKDTPFLPAKIGIKELGPEIWLEFILWCCVEHGHINEGVLLANKLTELKGWKFQSWKPLLRDVELLRNTRIDRELSTWPSPDSANNTPKPPKRTDSPLAFHGLGKQTISVEVVAALLDNLPNLVYMGMHTGGPSASELLRHANSLKFAITSPITSDSTFLPTTKATNWFATRVMETGGLTPEADPQMFDDFLKLTPHVVPPWNYGMCPVEEESLAELHPAQLYDDTSAFAGLMEYNLKYHSYQGFCGSALSLFAMLQDVMDRCKMRRVEEFFSSQLKNTSTNLPSPDINSFASLASLESSNPQLSNVTIAHLFELITSSRAFAFGEWLLLSDDIDGPTVPASAYGDQALAPSLLRFAAATKNKSVGESVIRSLTQHISLNTSRALLNYRIEMHEWDEVIIILKHIRDHRRRSWSQSNIATIAAELIRLDHILLLLRSSNATNTAIDDIEIDLTEAKKILHRILLGEFDELPWRNTGNPRYQADSLISFMHLFRELPSPSLREIANSAVKYKHAPTYSLPYISSSSFRIILAAVAETQGSLAAKSAYKDFCIMDNPPDFHHMVAGGITRFYQKPERDFRKGDPTFNAQYFNHQRQRLVLPNPNMVRIIAQAAVREYQAAMAETETQPVSKLSTSGPENPAAQQFDTQFPPLPSISDIEIKTPPTPTPIPTRTAPPSALLRAEQKANAINSLTFCIKCFKRFRMGDTEIAREIGEEFYSDYYQNGYQKKPQKSEKASDGAKGNGLSRLVTLEQVLAKLRKAFAKRRETTTQREEEKRQALEKQREALEKRRRSIAKLQKILAQQQEALAKREEVLAKREEEKATRREEAQRREAAKRRDKAKR